MAALNEYRITTAFPPPTCKPWGANPPLLSGVRFFIYLPIWPSFFHLHFPKIVQLHCTKQYISMAALTENCRITAAFPPTSSHMQSHLHCIIPGRFLNNLPIWPSLSYLFSKNCRIKYNYNVVWQHTENSRITCRL